MNKLYLGLAFHSHQPVGNFENVFESAYQKSYLPFIETFERHSSLKITLHYSGILIDWFQQKHPEFLKRLKALCHAERVEMMTGGHYEPILPILLEEDRQAQVKRLTAKLYQIFEKKPAGLWVAERVWEQPVAETLHDVGVEYVILDDIHFLYAGLRHEELVGYFITEEKGKVLKLVPGSKTLRYTIPFADPSKTIEYLKEIAHSHTEALVVMGDDCEKFGVWPKTYEHVYENGWLRRFFEALQENQDWLQTICVSDYLRDHSPLGCIYLPNASYPEMMEWVLPVKSQELRSRCVDRLKNGPEATELLSFIRGGFWRNFLVKYRESNFLHKKMLATSRRLQALYGVISSAATGSYAKLQKAYDLLLQAQCNDAYWHGVFGGLYAPHLRTALFSRLIEANRLADELEFTPSASRGRGFHFMEQYDFDGDGIPELFIRTRDADVFIDPKDGATVREIDFKPCATSIVNSLKRQEEFYHRYLFQATGSGSGEQVKTIHDALPAKEKNLDKVLRYDRYAKSSFRVFLFPHGKFIEDYDRQELMEVPALAQGKFDFHQTYDKGEKIYQFNTAGKVPFGRTPQVCDLLKRIKIETPESGFLRLSCEVSLKATVIPPFDWVLGIENVINFLAPDAPDRYISASSNADSANDLLELDSAVAEALRKPLHWFGVAAHRSVLTFTDEWRQVEVKLGLEEPVDWWVVPIYTVSQSEEGYEKVYQGSQVLAVLPNLGWNQGSTLVHHWMEIKKISAFRG